MTATYAEHTLDIYGTRIFCVATKRQWKALAKALQPAGKHAPQAAGQVNTWTRHPAKGLTELVIVVWIDRKNHTSQGELIDSCAHEASHAAGRILEHIGHGFGHTDETHAYLLGWLTRWVWEHVR